MKNTSYIQDTENGLVKGSTKRLEDVPENLAVDRDGNKMIYGQLKSWSRYTKKQRMETINKLIAEMKTLNVTSKKFFDILDTIEKAG